MADMQDEVRDKSVALIIQVGKAGAKLTAGMLKSAMRKYQEQAGKAPQGRQSVKSLVGQGQGVESIQVTDRNIRSFERTARKYGVDYALKKDPGNGRYMVFFKARDAEALNAAFREYTAKTLGRKKGKPSVLKQLSQFKEAQGREAPAREKGREKGGMER